MKIITLKCENREPDGTSHAKRMRRAGRLPSVVYGRQIPAVHVSVDTKDFGTALDGGARVVDLENPEGEVVRVDPDRHLLFLQGSVPGHPNALVRVRAAVSSR